MKTNGHAPDLPWPDLEDEDAFTAFHTTYAKRCTRLVSRSYARVRWQWQLDVTVYEECVDDAVADSFVQVRRQWVTLADKRKPLSLLVVIGRRRLLRLLEHCIRHHRYRADLEALADRQASPEPGYAARVHATLARLTLRQAHALTSTYFHQQSLPEVAAHLETTETGAHSLLQRSRARFKDLWVVTGDVPAMTGGKP